MTSVLNPNYLKFCGERLVDMYKWETEKIYDFLYNACTAHSNEETKRILITVYSPLDRKVPTDLEEHFEDNFKPLNPKTKKPDAKYNPSQHIYRTPTGEDLKLDTTSKFNVNLDGNWKHTTPDPARISGLASDGGVSYWNHYDLLGFILSLLKEDLDGAKKDNFFLPLTAVYGRWCAKIGGNGKTEKHPKPPTAEGITAIADKPKGVGAVPTVFQCTWMTAQDGVCFALGSSLAGFEKAGEKWKERLRTYRFDLLYGWNNIHTLTRETKVEGKKKEETWHFNNSPNRSVKGDAGTHFGNCGETYPFLHIFHSLDVKAREDVNGLALKNFFLKNEVLEEKYSPLEIHKKASEGTSALYLIPPCDNCEYLIQVAKGKKENFVYSPVESPTGSKDVPPR